MIGYWHGGKRRPLIKGRRICANEKSYNLLGDTEFDWGDETLCLVGGGEDWGFPEHIILLLKIIG